MRPLLNQLGAARPELLQRLVDNPADFVSLLMREVPAADATLYTPGAAATSATAAPQLSATDQVWHSA